MSATVLHSYSAAARRLGVHRMTVSDLARRLGMETRARANAKLLSEADVRRIARILRIDREATPRAS